VGSGCMSKGKVQNFFAPGILKNMFYVTAPNGFLMLVWNFLHVTLLGPIVSRRLLNF